MSISGHNILKSPSKSNFFVRKAFVFVSVWLFVRLTVCSETEGARFVNIHSVFALVIDLFPDVKASFFGLQSPKEVFDDYQ